MTPAELVYKTSAVAVVDNDELITQELSQVYYIASRIRERLPQHVELDDLVSAGVLGLLEAVRSFDVSKNVQFRTFAKFRIRGAIFDSLRESDWGSRYMRRKGREIEEATVRLEALWMEYCERHSFSLFCAYPRSGFTQESAKSFAEICALHSHIV